MIAAIYNSSICTTIFCSCEQRHFTASPLIKTMTKCARSIGIGKDVGERRTGIREELRGSSNHLCTTPDFLGTVPQKASEGMHLFLRQNDAVAPSAGNRRTSSEARIGEVCAFHRQRQMCRAKKNITLLFLEAASLF